MFRRFSIFSSSSLGFCLSLAWISGVGAGLNVVWYLQRRGNATVSAQPGDTAASSAGTPCSHLSQSLGLSAPGWVLKQRLEISGQLICHFCPQEPWILRGQGFLWRGHWWCSSAPHKEKFLLHYPGSEVFPDLLLVIFDSCL